MGVRSQGLHQEAVFLSQGDIALQLITGCLLRFFLITPFALVLISQGTCKDFESIMRTGTCVFIFASRQSFPQYRYIPKTPIKRGQAAFHEVPQANVDCGLVQVQILLLISYGIWAILSDFSIPGPSAAQWNINMICLTKHLEQCLMSKKYSFHLSKYLH